MYAIWESEKVGYKNQRHKKSPKKEAVIKTLDGIPVRKLFVGNLSPEVTQKHLVAEFKQFGTVVESKVIHGKKKPLATKLNIFGFVTFLDPEHASNALVSKRRVALVTKGWIVKPADSWHQPIENSNGELDFRTPFNQSSCSKESEEGSDSEVKEIFEPEIIDDSSAISMLNDDCLLIVFSYLTLPEQKELFSVCRRWKRLLGVLWMRIKELNFSLPPLSEVSFSDDVLSDYLCLCPNVTSLDLSEHPFETNVLLSIVNHCKKLIKLSINGNKLKHRSLALLAHHYPNLKSFSCFLPLDPLSHETNIEYEILQFVNMSTSLEELNVKYFSVNLSEVGMWLSYLTPPLKSLHLEGIPFESHQLKRGILNAKTTLREISLISCSSITPYHIQIIVKELPELTRLTLSSSFTGEPSDLYEIAKLTKLNHLSLEINDVTDGLIEVLSKNCLDLQTLELIEVEDEGLTEKCVKYLPRFPKLTHLNLSGNSNLTDDALHTISNKCQSLSYLSLQSCDITDVGCISIVTHMNSLEFLDIRNCPLVTGATVIAAIDAYRAGNKKKMIIAAGHTGIDFKLNWENPGVKVENCTSLSGSLSRIIGFEGMMLLGGLPFPFGSNDIFNEECMFDDLGFRGGSPCFYAAEFSDDEDDYYFDDDLSLDYSSDHEAYWADFYGLE